ncbi:MerR family transcriptional regulator [Candidatus Binatus soli]|jgi:DNA-binding transcriptional MerR regulator|uniref:MerR family transcriptional regulator n=1 Tax=Candidatus Binatus soli TaxID=1953413 RepID=UPI003D151072
MRSPAKSLQEGPPRRGLTIRQLVGRTGVTAPTVHHYVALGLLPEPERPHRRMAYYDPACVERIAQIKTLQTDRFIPLGVIKKLLDDGGSEHLREADLRLLHGMDVADRREPREEVLRRYPLSAAVVEALVRQGLLSAGGKPFTVDEAAIVGAVHAMRQAGLDGRMGFSVDQLGFYPTILAKLIDLEFATFNEKVLGRVPPDEEVRLATASIDASSKLLTALHYRMVRERLGELSRASARPVSAANGRRPSRRRPKA